MVKNKHQDRVRANNIWMYRKKLRLTQKEVAYLMGKKSPSLLSSYERGLKYPSLENALKLQVILGGVWVSFLFSDLYDELYKEIRTRRQEMNLPL